MSDQDYLRYMVIDGPTDEQISAAAASASPAGLTYCSVGQYRKLDSNCSGDLLDAMGQELPDDARITIRIVDGVALQYCVGEYDGNQDFMELY